MQIRLPRRRERYTTRQALRLWQLYARDRQLAAEAQLRQAGRQLELIPVDGDHARLARILFRLASRLRSDRLAADDFSRGTIDGQYSVDDAKRVVAGLRRGRHERAAR